MKNLILVACIVFAATVASAQNQQVETPSASVSIDRPIETMGFPLMRNLEISLVAESSAPAQPINSGDDSVIQSEQHIGFAHALSATKKIQFRQYFLYNMSDFRRDNEYDIGDHAIQYTDTRAFEIGNEPGSLVARLYLPGSDFSREVGKYEFRLYGEFEQHLPNRFSISYVLNPRAYAHTDRADGQPAFRIFPAVNLNYNLNPRFVAFAGAFTEHTWRHTGENVGSELRPQERNSVSVNYDALYHTVGVRTQPFKNLKVSAYTETEDSLRDGQRINWFDEDTTVYYLDAAISL